VWSEGQGERKEGQLKFFMMKFCCRPGVLRGCPHARGESSGVGRRS